MRFLVSFRLVHQWTESLLKWLSIESEHLFVCGYFFGSSKFTVEWKVPSERLGLLGSSTTTSDYDA